MRKKKEKNLIPWIVVLLLVMALAASWTILIGDKRPEKAPAATVEMQTNVQQATMEADVPPMAIELPFCTLYYPGEYTEGLRVEQSGESFSKTVDFYGTVAGMEQLLFSVYFCGTEGIPVGILETEEGIMMDVTVSMSELKLKDSWTAEEIDRICAMQESMNFVLENLKQQPSFTASE